MSDKNIEKLFIENRGLILNVIKKYFPAIYHTYDFEDYIQEGYIALYKAVKYFDESKGNKFSTLATTFIKNRLISYSKQRENKLKQYAGNKNIMSLYKPIGLAKYRENGDNDTLLDVIKDKKVNIEKSYINTEERKYLVKRLNEILPKRSKEVFRYILQGKSQKEISHILGCSNQNVSQCIKKIKECADLIKKEVA